MRGSRLILWDNNKDHEALQFADLGGFFRALAKADRSGKGYRIAYTGEAAPDIFEDWARGVWSILSGSHITRLLIEEYSDCCQSAGPLSLKSNKYHRRLWTQSRKYGGIIDATSQRPQLISKDSLGNAGQIWASSMDSSAAKRVGAEIDVDWRSLRELSAGNFYHWQAGKDAELHHVFTPRQ